MHHCLYNYPLLFHYTQHLLRVHYLQQLLYYISHFMKWTFKIHHMHMFLMRAVFIYNYSVGVAVRAVASLPNDAARIHIFENFMELMGIFFIFLMPLILLCGEPRVTSCHGKEKTRSQARLNYFINSSFEVGWYDSHAGQSYRERDNNDNKWRNAAIYSSPNEYSDWI